MKRLIFWSINVNRFYVLNEEGRRNRTVAFFFCIPKKATFTSRIPKTFKTCGSTLFLKKKKPAIDVCFVKDGKILYQLLNNEDDKKNTIRIISGVSEVGSEIYYHWG